MAVSFGKMNCHAVGIILKELVRRAIDAIREQRYSYECDQKEGYDGLMSDVVTSADRVAQDIYVHSLRECFPKCGIVAEENGLRIPCRYENHNIFFTIDPLDGTKAFKRGESSGVGTMIALVCDYEVLSAWVGNVYTKEIVGYRPESDNVYRIVDFKTPERLFVDRERKTSEMYVQLRDRVSAHKEGTRAFIERFDEVEVVRGSIGTTFTRLWSGVVGAVVLRNMYQTPWDSNPILGISKKLGYRFYTVSEHTGELREKNLTAIREVYHAEEDIVVTHPDFL